MDNNKIISMNEPFTDSCKSISECKSLIRITHALSFYQNAIDDTSLDLLQCNTLNDYFKLHPNLMEDYGHIIYSHISEDIDGSQYLSINKYILKKFYQNVY